MEEAIRKLADQHQRMAKDAHERQQQAAAEKMVEMLVKILSSFYDKTIAYTNVVIFAGYAAFFAIWGATKPALTQWISIASALLMVFSATMFVLFELFKMVHSSRILMKLQSITNDEKARKDPEVYQSRIKEFEALQRVASLRFVRGWVMMLSITVPTAVAAVGLLAYNYVCMLLNSVALGSGGTHLE